MRSYNIYAICNVIYYYIIIFNVTQKFFAVTTSLKFLSFLEKRHLQGIIKDIYNPRQNLIWEHLKKIRRVLRPLNLFCEFSVKNIPVSEH